MNLEIFKPHRSTRKSDPLYRTTLSRDSVSCCDPVGRADDPSKHQMDPILANVAI